MKQIYNSLLECKSKLIETQPEQALFLPIYGEHRIRKNNSPALCEWARGTRVIDLLSSNGNFVSDYSHIPNILNNHLNFRLLPSKIALKHALKIYTIMQSDDKSMKHVLSTFMVELFSKVKILLLPS